MATDLMLSPSELNPNTKENSEAVFAEGGSWEKRGGRCQTRRFAEIFHRHAAVPLSKFRMLDVGCGLGDGMPVWKKRYPGAELFGCDISEVAVRRCEQRYGHLAQFFTASFEQIEGFWDVIYCSNVLEHFEQHLDIARFLLARCSILYVMTPFNELRDGRLLKPMEGYFHVATFFADTFDSLLENGHAAKIDTRIFSAPGAWAFRHERLRRIYHGLMGALFNKPFPIEWKQVLYTMHRGDAADR